MKIEIWSDFICPYCYLGKRHLELALEQFPHKEKVIVLYKSFQLEDHTHHNDDQFVSEVFLNNENRIEKSMELNERLREQALGVGLRLNVEKLLHVTTLDAHRLVKHAETIGLANELVTKLFEAYFTGNVNLHKVETLISIVKEVGMDEVKAEEILQTCKYRNSVLEDMQVAEEMAVKGIPFFVINEKYSLSGAQPIEYFQQVLETIWEEEGSKFSKHKKKLSTTKYCEGNYCKDK